MLVRVSLESILSKEAMEVPLRKLSLIPPIEFVESSLRSYIPVVMEIKIYSVETIGLGSHEM